MGVEGLENAKLALGAQNKGTGLAKHRRGHRRYGYESGARQLWGDGINRVERVERVERFGVEEVK